MFNRDLLFKLLIAVLYLNIGQVAWAARPPSDVQDIEKFAVKIDQKKYYLMGDMVVDEKFGRNAILPENPNAPVGSKPEEVKLWRDGILPIVFKKDVEPFLQKIVWQACAEWSVVANVKCVKGPYYKLEFTIGRKYAGVRTGCWSMLGRDDYAFGIARRMNLGPGCEDYSTVLHELGHAFGLTHEHQRSDRDKYVKVIEDNIEEQFMGFTYKLNFEQQKTELLTPYDFLSIMHYSRKSFSKNGGDTIRPLPPYEKYADDMGFQNQLSEYDKLAIRTLYGAPK
jgi:Astacin (Peptidase family M12A)